jgi:exodeoxyribonuclease-3
VRLATWNVNSLKARLPLVTEWLSVVEPDVLCLQETKCADEAFPFETFTELGYEVAHHGDGRWNGVAICSRVGLEEVEQGLPDDPAGADAERRLVAATCGSIRVHSVYVPNGRVVGSEHYVAKLDFLMRLDRLAAEALESSDLVAFAGDFNVAPEDIDVFDPSAFVGSTHVTPEERAAVSRIVETGYADVFREQYPDTGGLFSWWDYRGGDFHKGRGMRIDLVLASQALARRVEFALVDRNSRKGQGSKSQPQPSDHAPVIVQFAP